MTPDLPPPAARVAPRLTGAVTALLATALAGAVWPGPLTSAGLQAGAVLTLGAALAGAPATRPAPLLTAGLVALALLPWLYLLPLPAAWFADQGGRALYRAPAAWLGADDPAWAPLTLAPFATWTVALDLLAPLAVFLAVRQLGPAQHARLLGLLLALAVAQGLYGLLQFASASSGSAWLLAQGAHAGSATGSFTNRNHLALLLEMLVPLAVLLTLRPPAGQRPDAAAARQRALGYGAVAAFLLLCLLFTRSRTGITLALLGLVLALTLGAPRWRAGRALGVAGGLLLFALGVASVMGLAPVIARFSVDALLADARPRILTVTLEVLRAWWPLGSGPGTYALVVPPAQPLTLPNVVLNHAHNDYLEWLVETGALGALLLSAALGACLRQGYRVARAARRAAANPLPRGAGLGLLLVAAHELVDYGLQIPLNQLVFAVLAGVFFAPLAGASAPPHPRAPRRPWRHLLRRRPRHPVAGGGHPAPVLSPPPARASA